MALINGDYTNKNGSMYGETSAKTNLRALANLQGINTITATANGLLGQANLTDATKRERRIEYFYDQMLLDTIKLGSENNVFLKYCKVKAIPKGNEKFLLRRWGGLTEHTKPLAEGIPPKSDHMASESFEGTYCQYGRYMEFTDRVEFNLIDDVIAHYSMELGDVAVRTAERLCREEMEAVANPVYANSKTFDTLVIGDTVGIADYRLQALKFGRRLIKPINGSYPVICSPEHIYDLIEDPFVIKYMEYTQTAEPYVTGQPVTLFGVKFEETMLDDFAYSYTEMSNPGFYDYIDNNTTKQAVRLVLYKNNEPNVKYYVNVPIGSANVCVTTANITVSANTNRIDATKAQIKLHTGERYLKDGSWIPDSNYINMNETGTTADEKGFITQLKAAATDNVYLQCDTKVTVGTSSDGVKHTVTVVKSSDGDDEAAACRIVMKNMTVNSVFEWTIHQLPTHKSFMFGDDFMYKTGIDGEMNAKFYVKEKGSAGVLDPIDQRQSVGFKINTLGFNSVRPEAIVKFVFVPWNADTTYEEVINDYNIHYAGDGGYNTSELGGVGTVSYPTPSTQN